MRDRENQISKCFVSRGKSDGIVIPKEDNIQVLLQFSKHRLIFHVVTIDKQILRIFMDCVIFVQKNRAATVQLLVNIMRDVIRVVTPYNRLIYDSIDRNPPDDIRVPLDQRRKLLRWNPDHLKECSALCWRWRGVALRTFVALGVENMAAGLLWQLIVWGATTVTALA